MLPAGFLKFKKSVFVEEYRAPPTVDEATAISLELLDEILVDSLGMHLLRPEIEPRTVWGVKPDIFQQKLKKNATAKHLQLADAHAAANGSAIGSAQQETPSYQARRSLSPTRSRPPRAGVADTVKPKRGKSMALEPYSPAVSENSGRHRSTIKPRTFGQGGSSIQEAVPPQLSGMHPALKLVLLRKESAPDLAVYQEAAAVLSDMTKVLAQGAQYNVPLDQMLHRYGVVSQRSYPPGASKAPGVVDENGRRKPAPRNRAEAARLEAEAVEQLLEEAKAAQYRKNAERVHDKLDRYRAQDKIRQNE